MTLLRRAKYRVTPSQTTGNGPAVGALEAVPAACNYRGEAPETMSHQLPNHPFTEGGWCFAACSSRIRELLFIPGAFLFPRIF
jgi:hypothetical protein